MPERAAERECTNPEPSYLKSNSSVRLAVVSSGPSHQRRLFLAVIDQSELGSSRRRKLLRSAFVKALPYVSAERIVIAPDCGMKYLRRDVAFGKMQAMVAGAGIVRAECGPLAAVEQVDQPQRNDGT